tara:strand:+ start:848 stop:1879 length:1032 start_codon:yes stop_codon:yes gene_type:complete
MLLHDKKINELFLYWLSSCLLLIFLMIIVGGLTRLTNSGLSITEWELFKGILPPLNEASWDYYFELYKEIPQYKLLNSNMTLNEFKIIFYWEYFHRILGRLIGLFFLIPLIYFYLTKKINNKLLGQCVIIFLLIVFQGIIGWYMVKSGLVNDVTVSHYRLSLHLSVALIISASLYWLIINLINKTTKKFFYFSKKNLPYLFLIFLIYIQIILGAFVSGLDAGKIYQTWPLMGLNYFPNDLEIQNIKNLINFNEHSLVQFYHRNLAYIITIYIAVVGFFILRDKITYLYKSFYLLLFFLIIQIVLGILTLISGLNIFLASVHQISSAILVLASLNLYYYSIKLN